LRALREIRGAIGALDGKLHAKITCLHNTTVQTTRSTRQ
jgi:hypothetical protein